MKIHNQNFQDYVQVRQKFTRRDYALSRMKGKLIGSSLKTFKQKVMYNMLIQEKTLEINI